MADELRRRPPRQRLTRAEQKEQTRERLLESAHALFALKGYEGTAIDEISADAGYSRGAFYSNFRSKQEIMAELIANGFDSDVEQIERMSTLEGVEALEQGFREIARHFTSDPQNTLWSLEFQLAAVRHPELRGSYTEQFDKLREGVRRMVVHTFRTAGHASPESTARYADLFIVILSGLSLMKLLYGESFNDALFGDAFVALVRGIQST